MKDLLFFDITVNRVFIIAIVVILIFLLAKLFSKVSHDNNEREIKRAGREGEILATGVIRSVLREGDFLFTNITVSYEGEKTELDNVIINKYGVFIIEVKNYAGTLVGEENEYEWRKFKITETDNVYYKTVKNPIKQVKREVYIFANYLDCHVDKVWVDGYAYFVNHNSPIVSDYVLDSSADIDRVIHTKSKNGLTNEQVESIVNRLRDKDNGILI